MRILLIEDDALIARDVIAHLERVGFVVVHERDGESGWFTGDAENFAAVILDLGLPGMDGLTALKRWRSAAKTTPVLILTARGNWQERVEGIDAGADDYLTKPFQMAELLARLPRSSAAVSGRPVLSSPSAALPSTLEPRQSHATACRST